MSETLKYSDIIPKSQVDEELVGFIERNIARDSEIKRIKLRNSFLSENLKQLTEEIQRQAAEVGDALKVKAELQNQIDRNAQLELKISELSQSVVEAQNRIIKWELGYFDLASTAITTEDIVRKMREELSESNTSADSFNEKMNAKEAELSSLRQKHAQDLKSRDRLILYLRKKNKSLVQLAQSERQKALAADSDLTKVMSEKQELEEQIKQQEILLKERVREFESQHQKKIEFISSDFELTLKNQKDTYSDLLATKDIEHASELELLKNQHKALTTETSEKYEKKIISILAANTQLTQEVGQLREAAKKLNQDLDNEKTKYDHQLARLSAEHGEDLRKLASELKTAESSEKSLNNTIGKLEEQMKAKDNQLLELSEKVKRGQLNEIKIKQINLELSNLNQEKIALKNEFDEKEGLVLKKEENIKKQEIYLSKFRATLNEAKEKLSKSANQLLRELNSAQHLSPLNELIAFTRFEIDRVSSALRRTPTSAPEWNTLEQTLKQLEEQRTFLQTALNESEHEILRQVQEVESLLLDGAFLKCPPSPLDLDPRRV